MLSLSDQIIADARKEISNEQPVSNVPHIDQVVCHVDVAHFKRVLEDEVSARFAAEIEYLKVHSKISAYRHLNSNRKIIGKPIVFVKKIIRKLIKFYVEPISYDQGNFNLHVASVLESLNQSLFQKEMKIRALEDELDERHSL